MHAQHVHAGKRWAANVCASEHALGRFSNCTPGRGPGQLSAHGVQTFQSALCAVADGLNGYNGTARLKRVLQRSKKVKTHTLLKLAGWSLYARLTCLHSRA